MTSGGFQSGITWIDDHPWLKAIAEPVSADDPVGCPVDEIDDYHDLDGELMKRGTLQHSEIRWPWIGDQAAKLLQKSKDLRLLSALLLAVQQRHAQDQPAFPLALGLSAQFLMLWADKTHPQGRIKPKLLARIGDLVEDTFPKDSMLFDEAGIFEACKKAAEVYASLRNVGSADLPPFFTSLVERLDTLKSEEPADRQPEHSTPPTTSRRSGNPAPAGQVAPGSLTLDSGNERALKQSLIAVADFMLQTEIAHPLSYRLRRYATWYGITATPPVKTEQKTVLQAVSEETADRYRTAVERSQTDAETVTKLERSCHLHPFWIDGQHLAFRLATIAGRDEAARAIREETAQFVHNLPGLPSLSFSDGTPFVSKDATQWLHMSQVTPESEVPAQQPSEKQAAKAEDREVGGYVTINRRFQRILESVRAAAGVQDYEKAFALLDQARASARSPRVEALCETVTLEMLSEWGLKANVAAQAARLSKSVEAIPVAKWEPELLIRLARLS